MSSVDANFRTLFENCDEQEYKKCIVKGEIPTWLEGEVIRNGPGEFKIGQDTFDHLFDGHAFLHKFTINDGQVSYSGKFIKTKMLETNRKHNRILCGGFGSVSHPDPCLNIFSRWFTKLTTRPAGDNTNVNVAKLGNAHYALTDAGFAYRFDPDNLDTIRYNNFGEILNVPLSTAHPHYDTNGDYYNVGVSFGRKSFYHIIRVPVESFDKEDPLMELQSHSKVLNDSPFNPTYYHSFGMTENYFVLHDQPTRISLTQMAMISITWDKFSKAFYVDKNRKSFFYVINKSTGEQVAIKYVTEPQCCFHFVNCYEEKSKSDYSKYIVVDMCCHKKSPFLGDELDLDEFGGNDKLHSTIRRFVLPLNVNEDTPKDTNLVEIEGCNAEAVMRDDGSIHLTNEDMVDLKYTLGSFDLPRINYNLNGKKYRYAYGISNTRKDRDDCMLKVDTKTKEALIWTEKNCFPSEPIFVPRPGGTEEEDGIILSTVISLERTKPAYLLILDAKTFKEIARAEVYSTVSMNFHGLFHPKTKQ